MAAVTGARGATFSLDFAPNTLDLDDLAGIVCGLADDESLWGPRVRFREDSRWWTRLHGDDSLDVWLLTWLHDQSTDLHDQGGSAAAFIVVQGELSEVRVEGLSVRRSVVRPGQRRSVAPGVVHDVRNPRGFAAISIHAYSPPLRAMTYYRRESSGRLAVDQVVRRELEP
jgi:mannose-6-phosphate isomerase-like protein (cupin superfamily)